MNVIARIEGTTFIKDTIIDYTKKDGKHVHGHNLLYEDQNEGEIEFFLNDDDYGRITVPTPGSIGTIVIRIKDGFNRGSFKVEFRRFEVKTQ